MNLQKGDKVSIYGDSAELWIQGYDCNVDSEAIIEETPKKNDKKVLVTIDYIDHEYNVCAYVRKSKIKKQKR